MTMPAMPHVLHRAVRVAVSFRQMRSLRVALALSMLASGGVVVSHAVTPESRVSASSVEGTVPGDGSGALSRNLFEQVTAEVAARQAAEAAAEAARVEAARLADERRKAEARASRLRKTVFPARGHISARFGESGRRWDGGRHQGVDFRVPLGTPIAAIQHGVVTFAGWHGSYGKKIVIRHVDGVTSLYAHLTSTSVRVGQNVKAGQVIGRSGRTGNATGPHLHLEVHKHGVAVNPLTYLR
jgi:murein DD-endopeptidase MepM/ murein hydrolase activator NlpD